MTIASNSMISEPAPAQAPISGAVFVQVDGTLFDSTHERAQAWAETLAEVGHEVRFERLWRLVGSGADILAEVAGLSADDEHAQHIAKRYSELFNAKYLPRVRPLPGARALLERLKVDGFRVLALSCDRESDALLGAAGLRGLLECSGEATPNCDEAIHGALLQVEAQCGPHKALVVASTPYMVKAAEQAGLRCVGLRSGGYAGEALTGSQAIYEDPQQLLEHLYEVLPRALLC